MKNRKKKHKPVKRKKLNPKALMILLVLGVISGLMVFYFISSSGSEDLGRSQKTEFHKSYEVVRGTQDGNNKPAISDRREPENRNSFFSWSVMLLLSLFFFASIGLNIFFIRQGQFHLINKIGRGKEGFSGKDKSDRELDTSVINAPKKNENDQLRSPTSKQQEEIKRLKKEVQQLTSQIEGLIPKELPEEALSKVVSVETPSSPSLPTTLISEPTISANLKPVVVKAFFEGPYEEGKFSVESGADERKFRYLYKIEYNYSDPATGKLHLEPTQVELDILKNYSDNILKPACIYINAFHSGLTEIIQLKPGKVIRQGDDWVVEEKVQIKFI